VRACHFAEESAFQLAQVSLIKSAKNRQRILCFSIKRNGGLRVDIWPEQRMIMRCHRPLFSILFWPGFAGGGHDYDARRPQCGRANSANTRSSRF